MSDWMGSRIRLTISLGGIVCSELGLRAGSCLTVCFKRDAMPGSSSCSTWLRVDTNLLSVSHSVHQTEVHC